MFKTKHINLNLAAMEDITLGNLLIRIGDAEFLALAMFFRCQFINFRSASAVNSENLSKYVDC